MSVVGFDQPVLPRLDDIERLLATLLGREVRVDRLRQGTTIAAPDRVACYRDRQGALRAVVAVDRLLGAGLGGALALIPRAAVEEDLESEPELPEHLADNLYEVLNICAGLFNEARERALHVRLVDVTAAADLDDEVRALLHGGRGRVDCSVVIPGYPGGELAVRIQ
jgi:hypothetical protein